MLKAIRNIIDGGTERYIYGAGDVSKEVYFCLSNEPYCLPIKAFVVSKTSDLLPKEIVGIPVVGYDDWIIDDRAVIIVSVIEKYREEICYLLDKKNINNRVLMTFESDIWSEFREESFKYYCEQMSYPFLFSDSGYSQSITSSLQDDRDFYVYVTRSTKDKPLKQTFSSRCWEKEIFAGAAIDHVGRNFITDDKGENISIKNRKYCELTAMYWIWKNTKSEYIGLSHYRRRFDEDDISLIYERDVDCVLTIPMINVPNVLYMYGKNHDAEDWKIMRDVVKVIAPEYMQALDTVEQSNYYVPYNMFIMKRHVFNEYSTWLFPILEKCEKEIGNKDDAYQNRYIGFLAERLMTAYFYHHKDDLKILFCKKIFLE